MEQSLAVVAHRGVAGDECPHLVRLEQAHAAADHGGDAGQSVEVVVDQQLAGDADLFAVGVELPAGLLLLHRGGLVFATLEQRLGDDLPGDFQLISGLEVRQVTSANQGAEGLLLFGIGRRQVLASDVAQQQGEVAGAVHCTASQFAPAHAGDVDAGTLQAFLAHLEQGAANVFAGLVIPFAQTSASLEGCFHAGGALLALVLGDLNVGAGRCCSFALGHLVDDCGAGLIDGGAIFCHLVCESVLEAGGANGTADLRHPATLSSENSLEVLGGDAALLRNHLGGLRSLRGLHFADFFHGAVLFRLVRCFWHCLSSNLSCGISRDRDQGKLMRFPVHCSKDHVSAFLHALSLVNPVAHGDVPQDAGLDISEDVVDCCAS